MFLRTPSRGGRRRWAAVDRVVCFGWGGVSCFFLFFLRMHTTGASLNSLLVMRPFFAYKATKSLHNEAVFAYEAKQPLHTGVRTGLHY